MIKNLLFLALFFTGTLCVAQEIEKKFTREINSMGKDKKVLTAFEKIDALDEWTIETLIELTEIPAPPFMEEKRAKAFAQMLKDAGADSVWIDAEGNVIALKKGSSGDKTVALDAVARASGAPISVA